MAAAQTQRPSEAIQDYAKAIYALQRRNDGHPVATNDLAERLAVTPASVSAMLKKLAELGGDARLEVLGDHMLERLGLLVDAVPRHAEVLGEVGLQQPVVAQHLERDPASGFGEHHAAVGDVLDQPPLVEPLEHRRDRGRRDPEPLREVVGPHRRAVGAALQRVDRLRVVLDRLGVAVGGSRGHQTLTSRPVANIVAMPSRMPDTAAGCSVRPSSSRSVGASCTIT